MPLPLQILCWGMPGHSPNLGVKVSHVISVWFKRGVSRDCTVLTDLGWSVALSVRQISPSFEVGDTTLKREGPLPSF